MADVKIMKAVEFDKLSAAFKKNVPGGPNSLVWDHGFWVQRKYDGVFGMASIHAARSDCVMHTRTGERIRSCDHILDLLHGAAGGNQIVVLGELWRPITEAAFPQISGEVRRHAPSPHLRFVMNDLLPFGLETDDIYAVRFNNLQRLVLNAPPDQRLLIAETRTHLTFKVTEWAKQLQESGGYDGAIIRDPNSGYRVGLVKNGELVKVKPVLSLDLAVKSRLLATGEKTGRDVYTLVVEYDGVETTVGSGVPHDPASVPTIGQIAEIECLGVTEDGKLREPRFKGVRFDKTCSD